MTTQAQIQATLAYLLGENNTPTGALATTRENFIQRTLEEIYRAYPWQFAGATATLTFASGIATLPANFDYQHKLYAYFYSGDTQTGLEEINFGDQDMYRDNDNRYWVEHIQNGVYKIVTKDTNYDTAVVKYQTVAPSLNATTGTPFSDISALALGARRYVKIGENPDADISQDEALFQKRLNESIAASQLNRPLKRHRKVYHANNYRLGDA